MKEIPSNRTQHGNGIERAIEARKSMTLSPTARNRQKILMAMRWIHGWGQSTTSIVKLACRTSSADFLTRMKERKLLRTERVMGATFLQLTRSGVQLLRNLSDPEDTLAALPSSRVVDLFAFHHNFYSQRLLAERIRKGPENAEWFCDRHIRAMLDSAGLGGKCPDAWYRTTTQQVFFEVERTIKKQPALEIMLLNISRMLEKRPNAICEIHIEPAISDRYRSTLGSWLARHEFRAWSLGIDGKYIVSGIYTAPDTLVEAMKRIQFVIARIRA